MKKSLLVLSLASFALVGCSNTSGESSSSNVEMAEANATWQAADTIQTAPMPTSMNSSITMPTYQATQPMPAQVTPTTNYGSQVENVGYCQVVRDSHNKPIYSQITKGCYTESTYTTKKHDTLYLIGYLTGTNANHIATLNNLDLATPLKAGQLLRVR